MIFWTICDGCFAPIDLIDGEGKPDRETRVTPLGAWHTRCPECGTFNSGNVLPTRDGIRKRLAEISAPILARLGDT